MDKILRRNRPVFQYRRLNWTLQDLYKLLPSPPPYNVVLAMKLAHTNPVVFKITLKEGRGEDRYLCSSVRGLIKNNIRKIRVCFQFVSSSFVRVVESKLSNFYRPQNPRGRYQVIFSKGRQNIISVYNDFSKNLEKIGPIFSSCNPFSSQCNLKPDRLVK